MVKKDQTDYATAYRQYCTYGRGRTLKKFCEDEDYNYTKLRRYVDKSFWNASKTERDSIGCQCVPVEVDTADSKPSQSEETSEKSKDKEEAHISISFVQVQLSNGLNLRVEAPAIDSLVDVLHKLVS